VNIYIHAISKNDDGRRWAQAGDGARGARCTHVYNTVYNRRRRQRSIPERAVAAAAAAVHAFRRRLRLRRRLAATATDNLQRSSPGRTTSTATSMTVPRLAARLTTTDPNGYFVLYLIKNILIPFGRVLELWIGVFPLSRDNVYDSAWPRLAGFTSG